MRSVAIQSDPSAGQTGRSSCAARNLPLPLAMVVLPAAMNVSDAPSVESLAVGRRLVVDFHRAAGHHVEVVLGEIGQVSAIGAPQSPGARRHRRPPPRARAGLPARPGTARSCDPSRPLAARSCAPCRCRWRGGCASSYSISSALVVVGSAFGAAAVLPPASATGAGSSCRWHPRLARAFPSCPRHPPRPAPGSSSVTVTTSVDACRLPVLSSMTILSALIVVSSCHSVAALQVRWQASRRHRNRAGWICR